MTTAGLAPGAVAVLAVLVAIGAVACGPAPGPSPVASPSASPASPATPTPTAPAVFTTPAPVPEGWVRVAIPAAGISLPVPATWEQVDADALGDAAAREDLHARYPGADRLLAAADGMGDRAVPAFIALDPAAAGTEVAIAPDIAVLVAQPAVGGPLLDFVAGFVSDGFRDAFEATEPVRTRVVTPVGEAVRLAFEIPADAGEPVPATAWVIAGTEGTLLVAVIGLAGGLPDARPDVVVEAAAPLP